MALRRQPQAASSLFPGADPYIRLPLASSSHSPSAPCNIDAVMTTQDRRKRRRLGGYRTIRRLEREPGDSGRALGSQHRQDARAVPLQVRDLAGKRILFIGIGFYDYESSIVDRLRSRGAHVRSFIALPGILQSNALSKLLRMAGGTRLGLIHRHERHILRRSSDTAYDHVLVIKSTELRPAFLAALRRQQGRAEFILYQWDSLVRMPGVEERLPFFDRILTFDRQDALARPNLTFRPLFYRCDSLPPMGETELPVDLCFVGWLHSDRLAVLRKLQAAAESQGMSFHVYLYTGLRTFLQLLLGRNARDVHVRTLSYAKLLECYRRATVIVDLPHARQSGLTMRAIEAVGAGRKLLTTARDIVHYDLYASGNVRVMPDDLAQLDGEFLRRPATPYPEKTRCRYSLDTWINDVFHRSESVSGPSV